MVAIGWLSRRGEGAGAWDVGEALLDFEREVERQLRCAGRQAPSPRPTADKRVSAAPRSHTTDTKTEDALGAFFAGFDEAIRDARLGRGTPEQTNG